MLDSSQSKHKPIPSTLGPGRSGLTIGPSTLGHNRVQNGPFPPPYGSLPDDTRLNSKTALLNASTSEKYSLAADPATWGYDLSPDVVEPDDWLHTPDPRRDKGNDRGGSIFSQRAVGNVGCLLLLGVSLLGLFAGYPIATFVSKVVSKQGQSRHNPGTNATGQVPDIGNFGLIDRDTPKDAYTITSYTDQSITMQLVFSDEFNQEGRSFYPGDDPYWEAVNLHYWQTGNLEWYDPSAVTTKNGALAISLSEVDDNSTNHKLRYRGGMIATWNKFCFTSGMVLASVTLPGANNVMGLWPAIWTMGNLGRAGYGASLDGMWPYTYDACDVGALGNQTLNNEPTQALTTGANDGTLSYLPGQRLSRCTCVGESHPGPVHSDGTYVGRSSPEIDIFEAQASDNGGFVSQSAQWAPFNAYYEWFNTSDNLIIYDDIITQLNSYKGSVYQQASSAVSKTAQDCYQLGTKCFATYGFEYKPGYDDAFISWINNDKVAWTLKAPGMAADDRVKISARPIPQEPLYLIINLGISQNFGFVDFDHLQFPAIMTVDWIRVYQNQDSINIGCDPPDFPTAAYIKAYSEAYTNPNLTTFVDDYKQTLPKNSLIDTC